MALIDRTKFDKRGSFKVLDFTDLDLVITNPLNESQRAQIPSQVPVLEIAG